MKSFLSESPTHSNIYSLICSVWHDHPSKPAIIFEGREIPFAELQNIVTNLERYFLRFEPCATSEIRVAALLENSPLLTTIFLLCSKTGCLFAPINTELKPQQQDHLLGVIKPSLIFSSQPLEQYDVLLEFDCFGCSYFLSAKKKLFTNLVPTSPTTYSSSWENSVLLTSSSGSTGKPKPIVFSQRTKYLRALSAIQIWDLEPSDVILNSSPFHHSLGQRLTVLPLLLGSTQVLLKRFSRTDWIQSVDLYNVSFTIPVTSHLHSLSKDPHFFKITNRQSFKAIVSSSASLDASSRSQLIQRLSGKFYEMYGASEIGTASVLSFPSSALNSVGKAVDSVFLKILHTEDHTEASWNDVGEIYVKTSLEFSGYLDNPQLTNDSYHEEYFATGDLGYLDANGFLYFKGRKNDCMKIGGINVYSIDIEECIESFHPFLQCKVMATDDSYLGSVPIAVISYKLLQAEFPHPDQLCRKLRAFCALNLAAYQVPRRIFCIREFPYLANGKIDTLFLRQLAVTSIDQESSLLSI